MTEDRRTRAPRGALQPQARLQPHRGASVAGHLRGHPRRGEPLRSAWDPGAAGPWRVDPLGVPDEGGGQLRQVAGRRHQGRVPRQPEAEDRHPAHVEAWQRLPRPTEPAVQRGDAEELSGQQRPRRELSRTATSTTRRPPSSSTSQTASTRATTRPSSSATRLTASRRSTTRSSSGLRGCPRTESVRSSRTTRRRMSTAPRAPSCAARVAGGASRSPTSSGTSVPIKYGHLFSYVTMEKRGQNDNSRYLVRTLDTNHDNNSMTTNLDMSGNTVYNVYSLCGTTGEKVQVAGLPPRTSAPTVPHPHRSRSAAT